MNVRRAVVRSAQAVLWGAQPIRTSGGVKTVGRRPVVSSNWESEPNRQRWFTMRQRWYARQGKVGIARNRGVAAQHHPVVVMVLNANQSGPCCSVIRAAGKAAGAAMQRHGVAAERLIQGSQSLTRRAKPKVTGQVNWRVREGLQQGVKRSCRALCQ